ncbi:MAG: ClpXP protease specificity-enhancing factor [bacterium]|jgi:stringent starvation protein B|nr:ClpXP protease specificity-enhancing factor [Betaproteobacteria bacterium]
MTDPTTKPYLVRAIYEWCSDSGYTPYISVKVDASTRVPLEYVKNGEIVLNISQDATRNITLGRDVVQFSARFNGVSREISVPIGAVAAIFAKENGQGLFFPTEVAAGAAGEATDAPASPSADAPPGAPRSGNGDEPGPDTPTRPSRPRLQVVK